MECRPLPSYRARPLSNPYEMRQHGHVANAACFSLGTEVASAQIHRQGALLRWANRARRSSRWGGTDRGAIKRAVARLR